MLALALAASPLAGFGLIRLLRRVAAGRALGWVRATSVDELAALSSEELVQLRARQAEKDSVRGWEELDRAIIRTRLPGGGGLA